MINLLPRDTVFYDLFEELARHAVAAAQHLHRLARDFPRVEDAVQRIRNEEHQADDLSHQALDRLDRTFITPFDREDIHELVGGLDDIIDEIDALAKRFPLYHIRAIEPEFLTLTDLLVEATAAMEKAVGMLRKTRKLSELNPTLIEIHRIESEADDHHHAGVSRLYEGRVDPLDVMKWKELLDRIERAIDNCEDVGHTLERVVLKNG